MVDMRLRVLLLGLLLVGFFQYQVHPSSAYSFQNNLNPTLLDQNPNFDLTPTALQANDGTLWVAWDTSAFGQNRIAAMFYSKGVWSATAQNITWGPPSEADTNPALAQLSNGTIILVWSSNQTGYYSLYYKLFNTGGWSTVRPLTVSCTTGCAIGDGDFAPNVVVGKDSSVWVFWDRELTAGAPKCAVPYTIVCRQLFYKTLHGNSWSTDAQLTSDVTWNRNPGATVLKDGTISLVYQKWIIQGSNWNIFSRSFNGTTWTADTQMTNVNTWDQNPDLVQDRNGTVWMIWERNLSLGAGAFEDKLFYQISGDGGTTWTPATQMTFGGSSTQPIDDQQPIPVQGQTRNLDGTTDHSLWIFFSSDAFLSGTDFAIYYVKTNSIFPVHDVAVSKIAVSPSMMFPWGIRSRGISTATINVTISNLGDFPENISYMVQVSNTTMFTVASSFKLLASGNSALLTINWNASLANPGLYTIVASITPPSGETIGARMDDTLKFKALGIVYPGDLNLSGLVSYLDASIFGAAWQSTPGSPNWNPDADILKHGRVDIYDASAFGSNWQKAICKCPP
jgi:hypothetical protein